VFAGDVRYLDGTRAGAGRVSWSLGGLPGGPCSWSTSRSGWPAIVLAGQVSCPSPWRRGPGVSTWQAQVLVIAAPGRPYLRGPSKAGGRAGFRHGPDHDPAGRRGRLLSPRWCPASLRRGDPLLEVRFFASAPFAGGQRHPPSACPPALGGFPAHEHASTSRNVRGLPALHRGPFACCPPRRLMIVFAAHLRAPDRPPSAPRPSMCAGGLAVMARRPDC